MVLTDVDDYTELWIARENPNTRNLEWTTVVKETLSPDFASRRPVRRDFAMEAHKVYPFINLFVEKQVGDHMIFHWRKPGDSIDSDIPADAFCTGWSNFHGGLLRVFFPFFLLPNVQVTFTIEILPNPSCPRLANTQLASAIQVLDYQGPALYSVGGTIQSSTSGSYPATFYGQDLCKLGVVFSVSDTSAASASVIGRFTPTQYIPAFSSLVVTLAGTNVFPVGFSSLPAHFQVSNTQTGSNNIRVEKFVLNNAVPFREKLLAAPNYQSNNPDTTTFASEIKHVQTNPGEDHFGKRWTGAFCPTLPGDQQYFFVLEDVDDYVELQIAQETSNSFTQVFSMTWADFSNKPLIVPFTMHGGKIYPFFAMFVEGEIADFLSLKWRTPGSTTNEVIPPGAFCTGWTYFNNSILQVYSPFAMQPGVEVSFSIQTLPNPLCPRSADTIVSSAIVVPHITLMNSVSSIQQSAFSSTYPDRLLPASSLFISLGKIDKKVLNISITSPVPLPSSATLVISLSGTEFVFEGYSVSLASPPGSFATASIHDSPQVLTVHVQSSQQFPAQTPIIFTFGNLTQAPASKEKTGISSSILSSDARCIASSSNGVIIIPRQRWVFVCGSAANGWGCE
jgi:hypothetical protein